MVQAVTGLKPVHIVPILSGEFLSGYRGRLANLNNCRRAHDLHMLMKACFPVAQDDGQPQFVANTAAALGIPLRSLIDRHTLWPLFAPFVEANASSRGIREPYSSSYAHLWMRGAREFMAMCPDCIAADLADPELHFSYWRRLHQVPGLLHCPWHGSDLRFIEPPDQVGPYAHELLDMAKTAGAAASDFARNSPIAQRTLTVLLSILEGKAMRERPSVTRALRERAQTVFGTVALSDTARALHARLEADVEDSWQRDLMPAFKGGRNAKSDTPLFLNGVIGMPSAAMTASAAALVAALVFDSVEQAASALFVEV